MSEFNFIEQRRNNISSETTIYVKKSFDIIERIHELMEEKGITQKNLADRLGKSEPEISKWINGVQNFTIKTLSKLEAVLGEEIAHIPCNRNKLIEFRKVQLDKLTKVRDELFIHNTISFEHNKSDDLRSETYSNIFTVLVKSFQDEIHSPCNAMYHFNDNRKPEAWKVVKSKTIKGSTKEDRELIENVGA